MVVGAFPLVKLGGLLLRQISKPIANYVKEKAKSNMFFRTYVCMPPAQFYNWCEIKAKMWILNLGKPVNIPVLSEAMAIELGANLLGEGIVFCIAASLLVAEYNRGANKEEAKENARKEEVHTLLRKLEDLYFKVEHQDAQIRELTRTVVALDKSRLSNIFKRNDSKIDSDIPPSPPPKNSSTDIAVVPEKIKHEIYDTEIEHKMDSINFVLRAAELVQKDITGVNYYCESNILKDPLLYLQHDIYSRQPISVK